MMKMKDEKVQQVEEASNKLKKDETETEEEPPFPHLAIAFLCMGMLAHSIVFTSPLPYVAFMIVDFRMTDDLDVAGYSAGWITGMFMVGRAIAGIPWGLAADRFGRRICMFISIFNVMVLGLLFGFSVNFYMAVAVRFTIGLGNGFMGVAKTYVSEIVKCKNHELRAFGYLNGIFALGMIVGPAIGGTLARPAIQYPSVFSHESIWGQYPYLLPNLACAIISAIAVIGIWCFMPETLVLPTTSTTNKDNKTKMTYRTVTQSENELDECSLHNTIEMVSSHGDKDKQYYEEDQQEEMKDPSSHFTIEDDYSYYSSEDSSDDPGFESMDEVDEENQKVEKTDDEKKRLANTAPLPATLQEILHNRKVQYIFINYMVYNFLCLCFDESFPLYAVTSIADGGLNWESIEVGETLATVGLGLVLYQLFIFERCMKTFFTKSNTDTLAKTEMLVAFLMPWFPICSNFVLNMILQDNPHVNTRTNILLRVTVTLTILMYRLPSMAAFTSISMIVNASVDAKMRGTMNGLMMTAGSLGNALGPILGSILYAAMVQLVYGTHPSENHKPTLLPIDGRAVFLMSAVLCAGLSCFTRKLLVKDE